MSAGKLSLPVKAARDDAKEASSNASIDTADLELMRLVYRHDKTPQDLVVRVREIKSLLLAPTS